MLNLVGRQRWTQEKPLDQVAAEPSQFVPNLVVLDSFRHDLEPKRVRELDDRLQNPVRVARGR